MLDVYTYADIYTPIRLMMHLRFSEASVSGSHICTHSLLVSRLCLGLLLVSEISLIHGGANPCDSFSFLGAESLTLDAFRVLEASSSKSSVMKCVAPLHTLPGRPET